MTAIAGAMVLAAVVAAGAAIAAPKPDPINLVVHAWTGEDGNDFLGFTGLVDDYDKKHKDVTVEIIFDAGQIAHHEAVVSHLQEGTGWADVVAVEQRTMTETLLVNPAQWAQLPDLGVSFAPFRWGAGLTHDAHALGLPLDMPSVAMCYRRDLFQAAGLPSDRDSVAALWPTWNDFLDVGIQYKNATGLPLLENAQTPFESIALQHGGPLFYDQSNTLVANSSAAIATAWNLSVQMAQTGVTSVAPQWTNQWFDGMSDGRFAAMICPSWILGVIPQNAPGLTGQWDIAAPPGGASYWGGTWLSVPATSQHQTEATELATYLSARKAALTTSQTATDTQLGGFFIPADLEAIDSAQVQNTTYPYFHSAPIGQIYTAHARDPQTAYLGPRYTMLRQVMFDALNAVETGTSTPEDAWAAAMAQIANIT